MTKDQVLQNGPDRAHAARHTNTRIAEPNQPFGAPGEREGYLKQPILRELVPISGPALLSRCVNDRALWLVQSCKRVERRRRILRGLEQPVSMAS